MSGYFQFLSRRLHAVADGRSYDMQNGFEEGAHQERLLLTCRPRRVNRSLRCVRSLHVPAL